MSARRGPGGPGGSLGEGAIGPGARTVLKLRFPAPAEPAPPGLAELLDRIDRLETRQSRRP